MNAVAAGRQALHLVQVIFIARIAVEFMPGVDKRQGVAIDHRRTGETAVFILRAFRRQRDRQMLPVHEIPTARMAPVHRPPLRRVRVVLIESVIPAVKPHQTVRVVDPAGTGRQMVTRVPTRVDILTFCLQFEFRVAKGINHILYSFSVR